MSAITNLPIPTIPPEVSAFAAERGVAEYLPAVLEMTRQLFPLGKMTLTVEDDPELSYNRSILIEVELDEELGVEGWLERNKRWTRGFFEACPAPLVHLIDHRLRSET